MKEAEDPVATLNELGADGWEFVDTIDYVGGGTKLLILKRPVAGRSGPRDDCDAGRNGEAERGYDREPDDGGVDESESTAHRTSDRRRTGGGS